MGLSEGISCDNNDHGHHVMSGFLFGGTDAEMRGWMGSYDGQYWAIFGDLGGLVRNMGLDEVCGE